MAVDFLKNPFFMSQVAYVIRKRFLYPPDNQFTYRNSRAQGFTITEYYESGLIEKEHSISVNTYEHYGN